MNVGCESRYYARVKRRGLADFSIAASFCAAHPVCRRPAVSAASSRWARRGRGFPWNRLPSVGSFRQAEALVLISDYDKPFLQP